MKDYLLNKCHKSNKSIKKLMLTILVMLFIFYITACGRRSIDDSVKDTLRTEQESDYRRDEKIYTIFSRLHSLFVFNYFYGIARRD